MFLSLSTYWNIGFRHIRHASRMRFKFLLLVMARQWSRCQERNWECSETSLVSYLVSLGCVFRCFWWPRVPSDPMSLCTVSQVMKREKLLDMLDGGQLNSKLTLTDIQICIWHHMIIFAIIIIYHNITYYHIQIHFSFNITDPSLSSLVICTDHDHVMTDRIVQGHPLPKARLRALEQSLQEGKEAQ